MNCILSSKLIQASCRRVQNCLSFSHNEKPLLEICNHQNKNDDINRSEQIQDTTIKCTLKPSKILYNFNPIYFTNKLAFLFNNNLFQATNLENYLQNSIHTRCSLRHYSSNNIPSYLKDNVTPIDLIDFEEDDELVDLVNEKEFEIMEYFNSRLINYEDADSNFTLPCPSCSNGDSSKNADIFVDKISGFFVCPSCCMDGQWEDLVQLYDIKEDSLTEEQLTSFISSLIPIESEDLHLLKYSPLKSVSLSLLQEAGALLTDDRTRLIVPVKHNESVVGFHSLSLIHQDIQFIERYLKNQSRPFIGPSSKKSQNVVVVPSFLEVLHLAQMNIHAMTIPKSIKEHPFDNLGVKEVILWVGDAPTHQLLKHVRDSKLISSFVRSSSDNSEILNMKKYEIRHSLNSATFTLSHYIKTFTDFKEEIYYRLTHKSEVLGVQWSRFKELNNILLGHRKGELTIVSGPTGSGKTTFISEYSLDLCIQGVRTLWGSFEVGVPRLCEVIMQQYHGKELPIERDQFTLLADEFSELPLYFLAFHGQQSIQSVVQAMKEAVLVHGVEHVVIDNLQFMLGVADSVQDMWMEQDRAVSSFRRFATSHNCHITLIAHPKKVESDILLLSSISGGARVTQEADNVMLLQVKNPGNLNSKKVIQVAKNRYGGTLGTMPLKFHKESITMSSHFRRNSENLLDKSLLKDDTPNQSKTNKDQGPEGKELKNKKQRNSKKQNRTVNWL